MASMPAMGSGGVQSSLIRILGAADPSVTRQSGPWQNYNMVNENRGNSGFGWTPEGRQEKLG